MSNPVSVGDDLVAKLNGWAAEIDNDGTPSQIGPTPDELRESASQLAEVTAANKALMAERVSIIATKREQLEQMATRAQLAEEAENEAKDCFWAIYPDWVEIKGHGISTEAARTMLAERATAAEAQLKAAREENDALERMRSLMAKDWFDFCETMGVTPDTQEAVAYELNARAALDPKAPS